MKYNYIVIGAGSGGGIIANRLSADPKQSVLVIEAGSDYVAQGFVPDEVKYLYGSSNHIWDSVHNWQFQARATNKSNITIARGKIVGGSGAINSQIFLRGMPQDYDNWARNGNNFWSFQSLRPYFNNIETDQDYIDNPVDFHGTSGPVKCWRYPEHELLDGSKAFMEACISAGFPYCVDSNKYDTTGVGPLTFTHDNGTRWSTATGYLQNVRQRTNLTIWTNSTVKKILFEMTRQGPQAHCIEVVIDGISTFVEADEIIVSAGAIGSPQLLMLSGIGPQEHLKKHGIPPILNMPGVGQNLSDHPLIPIIWATKHEVALNPIGPNQQVGLRYTAQDSKLKNDMIVYMNEMICRKNIGGEIEAYGFTINLGLNLALSHGELLLRSDNYMDQPHLDYNLLDDEEDLRRCRDGIRAMVSLENHTALAERISRRMSPLDSDLQSNTNLDNWLRENVGTGHHISCTAKMGPKSDPMSVVDQTGRVHGVRGLRIVDASIMPTCVRANINATVMVMAERIADFITNHGSNKHIASQ